ncbi:GUCY1B3 [Branchiostoma lanceolatum]|uniref:guanylate cyclase n=1 Tax=Branchiostoma lanceolatum TaxID=7740 RepID=A0A8K0A2P6_BRALA|nr:GUCY1B3 [Branchiostoma lanceolatum]
MDTESGKTVLRLQQVVFELVSISCVRSPIQNGLLPAARHLHLRGQLRYMPVLRLQQVVSELVLRLQQVVFELVSISCVRSPIQNGLLPSAQYLHLRGQMCYMSDRFYVLRLQQVVFELVSISCVRSPIQNGLLPAARHLHLRGQMRYMPDWDCVIFLCSPLIQNTNEMLELGLYINDLSMHDNSRELVMAGTHHMASLEVSYERPETSFLQLLSYRRCLQKSYDKAVKYSEQLCENMKKCEDWRKHSDELLYQMIPRTVADRLRRGMDVNDTVEAFPEVTVMFSYLVGFMEISAKVPAVQLVETINDFFTLFDTISLRHDVFKFETLGDAVYMVVGGAPERNPRHAQCVAALALELNREVERLKNPIDGTKLKVKIGMHSGPVVAGVISLKMPQYCMVGDTVNTASRMGTNSEPGKITLSESVNKLLYFGEFITAYRGTLQVKGKGRMKTYWLVGTRSARPCSPPSLLMPPSWKDLQRGMSIEIDCMQEVEKKMHQKSPLQEITESKESLAAP